MSERIRPFYSDDRSEVSRVSNVSLNENERNVLHQRKEHLERELNSLSVILNRPSRSVPNASVERFFVQRSLPLRTRSQRGHSSIQSEQPFFGFSELSSPHFHRLTFGGTNHDNIWIPAAPASNANERSEPVQPIHQSTQNERLSNLTPRHHDVNVIVSGETFHDDFSSSSKFDGLKTIDEWVEDARTYNNNRQLNRALSVSSTINHAPLLYQNRDNAAGSTIVELQKVSVIDPRYGEKGTHGLIRSENRPHFKSNRITSENCSWGSTKVELPYAPERSEECRRVNEFGWTQREFETNQRLQHQFMEHQRRMYDTQLRADMQSNRGLEDTTKRHPQNIFGQGSTKVELQNTLPNDCCGETFQRKGRQQQFWTESVDSKPLVEKVHAKREFGETFDGYRSENDLLNDQENKVPQVNTMPVTQFREMQIGSNDAIMTKLVSRQILGKDLPEFSGDISKWLSFLDHYTDTTKSCQFTDRENIMRLRKSLKGEARECVESLLISSTSAEKIIAVLERRFGRPDDIVKMEIRKVKTIPSPRENDPHSIIKFATAVQNLVVTLETLKQSNHLRNPILLDELQDKLPTTLNLLWSEYIVDRQDDVTLRVLADWLDRRAEAASRRTTLNLQQVESSSKPKFKARINALTTTTSNEPSTNVVQCFFCHGTCESIETCDSFLKLDVHNRWKVAKENKLCYFCLSANHVFKDCMKKIECKVKGCKRFHHKLLHLNAKKIGVIESNFKPTVTKLRIVPVILYGQSAEIRTFALLDPGSTSTLISDKLSKLLKLDGQNSPLILEWMNGDVVVENNSKIVDLKIQGTYDGAKIYNLCNIRTVENLPLHKQTIDKKALLNRWPYLRNVDFEGYENAQPELLIGENNGLLTATRQLVHDKWNTPIASKTWLGWVISGNEGKSTDPAIAKVFTVREFEKDGLHELVQSSFRIENDGVDNQKLSKSKEDDKAIQILEKHSIMNDNRWETGLLWRDETSVLPESRKNAFLRLMCLEKKLDKNPQLRQRYNDIISEYLDKKFLRKCEKLDVTPTRTWYLPHFPVLNPMKPGKVRIVFDAAAKSNGFSLNDYLMTGPDLLKSLIGVLFKFRQGKIGFVGDIKDMFHRVKMRQQDTSCQRILWRGDSRTSEPEEYELAVMSFGANCSPCSAIYIKNRNALRFQDEYPQAVDAILNKHYMDDYLDSCNDEQEAMKLIRDVIHVHSQGSFEIRNWMSSSRMVMEAIPEHLRKSYTTKVNLDCENVPGRILGILWDPVDDVFTFKVDFAKIDKRLLSGEMRPTKRSILSIINSVFDPLGFVAHLMVIGKIILRNVWRTGIDWDDVIDDTNFVSWKLFLGHLQRIETMKINRCYTTNFMTADDLQLHVFCDASSEAYSTIAFFRIQVGNVVEVKFVMAKTRVAPIKSSETNGLTIPRLELEAALLGSKISQCIIAEHNVNFDQTVFWTDSTTVWYWIKSETKRYKQFVANRLGTILELTKPSDWMWVPSSLNPADDATRSNKAPDFDGGARWYIGPDFLYNERNHWPTQPDERMDLSDDLLETVQSNNLVVQKLSFELPDVTRFSKWLRLLRTTAWILRFMDNCRKRPAKNGFELTVEETERAETLLVRDSQQRCFPSELASLKRDKFVGEHSRLYTLCPKLDECGIIRMHGRTDRLPESFRGVKEPVILDGKDGIVKLLIRRYHERANHFGHETVLNELRQRYWIIGAKVALRAVRHECNMCKLLLAKPSRIVMGQLPLARVTPNNPVFTYCGVDYFGPMLVKVKRSNEKRYGVLFTCLTVRAVHIEIAHSLTTDSCIMALRRFTAKNICPKEMYSDNGTNLKGCDKELQENLDELDQDKIRGWMTTHRIKWFFNPPTASNMGGSWERMVRSIKIALYATLVTIHPSDEVLETLLAEAQHISNSRPLLELSNHPNEQETLTPNHFLVGISSASAPIGEFDSKDLILKKQWRASQHLADLFWQRWLKEFLPTLTKRTKWFLTDRKPKVGDFVLIADPNEKRGNWPKGKITAVFPGIDGEIRVVDVTTQSGTYRRPMNKVCIVESSVVGGEC